jgi:hypothetical protein
LKRQCAPAHARHGAEWFRREAALVGLRQKIDECHDSCRDAREVVGRYKEPAGVETIDALRDAIQRSDQLRQLQTEFEQLANALA